MLKIALVTMPALELDRPSLSLTQLQQVLKDTHGERVEVSIHYANHDFAHYLARHSGDTELYGALCANQHTGLPDWYFRQSAFPELADNTKAYFQRYYPGRTGLKPEIKDPLLAARPGIDAFLDEIIERDGLDQVDFVGFTSIFAQNVASFAMARRIKLRNPDVMVLVGGANGEAPMGNEVVTNVDAVDYVFSGPALISLPEFIGHHLAGTPDLCETIPGVLSATNVGRPKSEQMGVELPIDAPVPLDYSDYFASIDSKFPAGAVEPTILFETSRGCWWGERSHCTFCGLNGANMGYRSMEADRAVELINSLFERYGDRSNYYFCVDNILPKHYPTDVLPRLKTPEGTKIFYEVKSNLSDEEMSSFRESGVRRIQPGIEALATSTLRLMRKGATSFVNLKLLKNCVRYDIEPIWNLLVGFPGETEDVFELYVRNIPRITHLWPPQGVAQVRYDRYSPYFNNQDEFGLRLRPFDFYSLIYPFSEDTLSQLAYYFVDENYAAPHLQALSKHMQELWTTMLSWRERWSGGDDTSPPELRLEERAEGAIIVDTRGKSRVEHVLTDSQAQILELLEEPRPITDLGQLAGPDIDLAFAELDNRGLVWLEGDRAMSLVCGVTARTPTPGTPVGANP